MSAQAARCPAFTVDDRPTLNPRGAWAHFRDHRPQATAYVAWVWQDGAAPRRFQGDKATVLDQVRATWDGSGVPELAQGDLFGVEAEAWVDTEAMQLLSAPRLAVIAPERPRPTTHLPLPRGGGREALHAEGLAARAALDFATRDDAGTATREALAADVVATAAKHYLRHMLRPDEQTSLEGVGDPRYRDEVGLLVAGLVGAPEWVGKAGSVGPLVRSRLAGLQVVLYVRADELAPLVLATALRAPHALCLALQAQLGVQLPPSFLKKLRARPNLSERVVRALRPPVGDVSADALAARELALASLHPRKLFPADRAGDRPNLSFIQHTEFRMASPLPMPTALASALELVALRCPSAKADPLQAGVKEQCVLVDLGDDACADEEPGPSCKVEWSSSPASELSVAVLLSEQLLDGGFSSHSVHRLKLLLRLAHWAVGADPPQLLGVLALVAEVCSVLGRLAFCPPELLISVWSIRGYASEKLGQLEIAALDYLQALAGLEDIWGDARARGGRGHPFALFLSWKLLLLAYLRGDGKAVDKFADLFRALREFYPSPFPIDPPIRDGTAKLQDAELVVVLAAQERRLKVGLHDWWREHDPARGLHGARLPRRPAGPDILGRREARDTSIASEMQEVRRGTLFAVGSNRNGQLGVGLPAALAADAADIPQTGRPVRAMAFKDCRLVDIACGEDFSFAIEDDGQVYLWGRGKVPHPLVLDVRVEAVACGAAFAILLDFHGQGWGWGDPDGGVLGTGTSPETSCTSPSSSSSRREPSGSASST